MKYHTKNLLLVLTGLIVGLIVCDGLFRLHERYVLLSGKEPIGEQVNLAELNYNDSEISRKKGPNE